MGASINSDEIAALVQPDRVHKRVYTDPAIFDLEMERIWGNAWIFIGHESQVKSPGDFFTTTLGKQPVIVTRHSDNQVYVLYNRCAHKGAQLTVASPAVMRSSYVARTTVMCSILPAPWCMCPRREGYSELSYSVVQ